MPAELKDHPSSAELHSFAHGRLPVKEMDAVERHIAQCDSCCKVLESVPEDTLVQMAREAATEAFRAGEAVPRRAAMRNKAFPRNSPTISGTRSSGSSALAAWGRSTRLSIA